MKAVLCKEFGPPETLVVEDIASPEPGPGDTGHEPAGSDDAGTVELAPKFFSNLGLERCFSNF